MDDVGLQYADLAVAQQRLQVVLGVAALAGRKARADAAADLGERRDVLGIARLLDPVQPAGLQLAGDRDGRCRAEAAVAVDHDLDLGTHRLAHGLDQLHGAADRGKVGIAPGAAERIELQARIAAAPDLGGRRGDLRDVGAGAVPGIGVGRHLVAHPAAEQLVDRLAQRLADDVPERHLDRADRAVEDRPAARELVAEHVAPQPLDLERRAADHMALGELRDRRLDGRGLPFAGALADAGDAVVGVDLREHPVAPARADQVGVDSRHPAMPGPLLAHRRLPFPDHPSVCLERIHRQAAIRAETED